MKTSVALCTYDGEEFLKEQLDSILEQKYPVQEIVICDDGSTDQTSKILQDYKNRFPDLFTLIFNEENLGYSRNFEKAIHSCKQDLIIICDQDDIWEKNKTEEIINFMKANPEKDGVFHDLKLIEEEKIYPSYLEWKFISKEDVLKDIENSTLFNTLVSKGSFVLGCSLAIRKTALQEHNLKDFTTSHDYYIAQKLSVENKLGFIPKTLSQYRLHAGQVYGLRYKSDNKKVTKELSELDSYFKENVYLYLKILERYKELNPGKEVKKTLFYKQFLEKRKIYLKMMNFAERKIYIAKCVKHHYLYLNVADLLKI